MDFEIPFQYPQTKFALILALTGLFLSWLLLVVHEWMQMEDGEENQYPDFLGHLRTILIPMPDHVRNRGIRLEFLRDDDEDID